MYSIAQSSHLNKKAFKVPVTSADVGSGVCEAVAWGQMLSGLLWVFSDIQHKA